MVRTWVYNGTRFVRQNDVHAGDPRGRCAGGKRLTFTNAMRPAVDGEPTFI